MVNHEPEFKITYANTFGDMIAFAFYHQIRQPVFVGALVLIVVVVSFLNYSLAPFLAPELQLADRIAAFVVFLILDAIPLLILVALVSLFTILSVLSRKNRTILAHQQLTLTEEHIEQESKFGRTELKWTAVQSVSRTRRFVFLYVTQHNALVVPRRAFESPQEMFEFFEYCRTQHLEAHES